jgi:hypothetical protein
MTYILTYLIFYLDTAMQPPSHSPLGIGKEEGASSWPLTPFSKLLLNGCRS